MANIYSKMGGPVGANLIVNPRRLSDGLGVNAVDMRRGSGDFRPLRLPVPVVADAPAISSLLVGSTVVEGNPLSYTATLARPTILAAIYSISWGGGTASSADYIAPPTFTNGVTLISGNTQIVVPAGVSSFVITFATVDDTIVESTEDLPLTIGGVTASGGILDNDAGAYSCPISSYREFTIPTSPEVTYGGNYLNQPPPTTFSGLYTYEDSWPSKHGISWRLGITTVGISRNLHLTVNDPPATRANTIYFEHLGAMYYEVDLVQPDGTVVVNAVTGGIDLVYGWRCAQIYCGTGKYIKAIRFIGNHPTSIGGVILLNVKTYCSEPPEFAPMNQAPLYLVYGSLPASVSVTAPATAASTNQYVDATGTVQPALYYPQEDGGASYSGWCWVIGSPLDSYGSMTIDVANTSVTKYDGVSFESNGAVRIEVWDEYASLAGPPSYTFTPNTSHYGPSTEWGKWNQYRSWPLVHPPIGAHGNIKRIRLTGLDPSTSTPLSATSAYLMPPSIYNVQLFPVNSVSQRTDVGRLTFS